MFRPNSGHLQVLSWKAVLWDCYTIMETHIGVEHSSTHHLRVWLDMAYSTGVKSYIIRMRVSAHVGVAAWWGGV